jgi:signal transduction histidine kinase/DNA-binding response OmpR family regulator
MSTMRAGTEAEVLFAGGGELGMLMRAYDWEQSPLGPVAGWPQSLKTCVRIILTSRQPMFVWWGEHLINLYNDAYKAIVGGKHPGALGQPAALVWKEIWDEVGPRSRSAIQRNEGTYDEALLLIMERHGYPEETYYTFSYSPVPNDEGEAGGIICANSDDTQRIIGERQLTLLRVLAADTAEARTVEHVSSRAARVLESNRQDLPFALIYLADAERSGMTLAARVGVDAEHPVAAPALSLLGDQTLPFAEVLSSQQTLVVARTKELGTLPGGAWSIEPKQLALVPITAAGEQGRAGVLVVGLNPYRLFDEGYRGFVQLIARQIGASIANAEAYALERQRAEALAELDRAKTAFFSNVSHEFRTPLTLMLGPLEDAMASPGRSLSPENLETAYRNALRLLKLVNTLLDFSRIEAGRVDAAFEAVDLGLLTADLASAFRSAMERAGLTLEVAIAPLDQPVFVDRDMWEKIVLNLLSNALKFTFEGGVTVRLGSVDGQAELTVADTGSGMAESELEHVFERFHRVLGARSRTHEGSGIGLALVNELVRLHGGTIRVQSQLDVGSTFTIRLPFGSAHLPKAQLRSKRSLGSTATGAAPYVHEAQRWLPSAEDDASSPLPDLVSDVPPGADDVLGARVLLADDNADMRDYVARLLRGRFQVQVTADGKEALAAALAEPPDLVLSDIMMPELDGFGLLRALRADERTSSIPVLMLSARAGDEARIEGLEAGADDYLVKPFSARELVARVSTHLQIARLRKTAERERTRLYDIFMQVPVACAVMIGAEFRFEVANPAYCEMVNRSNIVGKTFLEVFPELHDHASLHLITRVLETQEPERTVEMNVPIVRKGRQRNLFFNINVQPLQNNLRAPNEQADGIVVIANEVTEQVLARQRVDGLRATAEQASRAKDEFLSTLSHELRTPLNAIIGWATLLRQGNLSPERIPRALETVERNAYAQARLIDDMLDLSRIEQGKLVLSVGPLEMVRVVEAAIEAVRPAADAKGVRLQPVLDSHATIVGDADRLQQVVWNLLSNAIKFTPKEGRVMVRLRREHSFVEIAVADNGQGISGDFLPFVFDRFRQADPTFTRTTGGLGLGLAIVRSLVELHGGTVSAESDGTGHGATFVVRLPTAPLRAEQAPMPEAVPQGAPHGKSFECPAELKGLRVLVVDDEPETRDLLSYVIEQCDAQVQTAADAMTALHALASQRFDVLISDIGMPVMDGYALIQRVRALPADRGGSLPALSLTAYARSEDRTRALRAGFNMHLAKPIDPSELLVVLAAMIRSHRQRSEP